jgi:hypothetical protein
VSPLEFLKVEFENVGLALRETLRHDYVPRQSEDYYRECEARLTGIGQGISSLKATDADDIAGYLAQLANLTTFVSLIERSKLGEFSWPFAEELRRIAKLLLAEKDLKGDTVDPIIDVISEGQGYRIVYEPQVAGANSKRRFLVIAFPRSLKHQVLLHALFGHEVGHTALHTAIAGSYLQGEVLSALIATSPLKDVAAMNTWVASADADQSVKDELALFSAKAGRNFSFTQESRNSWLIELICDLFGLLLFGPAFLAAHHTYLQALHPKPYGINTHQATHPPFAIRHKMLVQIMRQAGWDQPITVAADGTVHQAELAFMSAVLADPYSQWAQLFSNAEIAQAIAGIRKIFQPHGQISFHPLQAQKLKELVERLGRGLPPILASIDPNGKPQLESVHIAQTLQAGWIYWIGRDHFKDTEAFVPLDFLNTNKLCDQALLQQRAINLVLSAGATP